MKNMETAEGPDFDCASHSLEAVLSLMQEMAGESVATRALRNNYYPVVKTFF